VDFGGLEMASETSAHDVPYKLSVMLWTVFTDLPFERRLEKVAEAGYTHVELVGEYENWSANDFDRANAKCERLGITFDATAGLKHFLSNPADREALLADLREALTWMEKLDCPSIILLSGNVEASMTRKEQHQSCIDGLKAATELVNGRKIAGEPVRLLLEHINPEENPNCFLTTVTEAVDVAKAVSHPQVQVVYDFFHQQIAQGHLIDKLEKNLEHVGVIHVADVPGRHEPGTGEINYENIFRKLGELRYGGVVAMEFFPTSDSVTKLRQAHEMAEHFGREGFRK
jgi:hydroxypyruvate isomerase